MSGWEGTLLLKELYQNSQHVPNLTRSLSPPSILGEAELLHSSPIS